MEILKELEEKKSEIEKKYKELDSKCRFLIAEKQKITRQKHIDHKAIEKIDEKIKPLSLKKDETYQELENINGELRENVGIVQNQASQGILAETAKRLNKPIQKLYESLAELEREESRVQKELIKTYGESFKPVASMKFKKLRRAMVLCGVIPAGARVSREKGEV